MKKHIDWGEVFLSVSIFIVAGMPTICMIIFLIFPSTRSAESEETTPPTEIVMDHSSKPSPSNAPTQATIPPTTLGKDPCGEERFAAVYDGAVLEYATISTDGLQDVPSWLKVEAYVDNGEDTFDICAPVEGNFETVDVPIYNPSQFAIRFTFEFDGGNFDGELIESNIPEEICIEFVLEDSAPGGCVSECADETLSIFYAGADGDDHTDEYYFCPDITVKIQ